MPLVHVGQEERSRHRRRLLRRRRCVRIRVGGSRVHRSLGLIRVVGVNHESLDGRVAVVGSVCGGTASCGSAVGPTGWLAFLGSLGTTLV